MLHTYSPNTQAADAEGSPSVQDQPVLHSEVKASLSCIAKSCLKNRKKQTNLLGGWHISIVSTLWKPQARGSQIQASLGNLVRMTFINKESSVKWGIPVTSALWKTEVQRLELLGQLKQFNLASKIK